MSAKVNGNGKDAKPPRDLPIIRLDQLKLRESAHNIYLVIAPDDLRVADVLKPAVWSAVAFQLVPFDIIRVFFPAETTWAELLVRQAQTGRCAVVLLRSVDIGSADPLSEDALPPNHDIRYHHEWGWIVERTNPDKSVTLMAKGCDHGNWDKEGARTYIKTHATVLQSTPGRRSAG